MRKVKLSLIVIIVLSVLLACASFDKNSYKAIAISQTSYDKAMRGLVDLQVKGLLSDSDVKKVLPYARGFYQAYLVAEAGWEVYHMNPTIEGQDALLKLIGDVAVKLAELSQVLIPYNIKVEQIIVPKK